MSGPDQLRLTLPCLSAAPGARGGEGSRASAEETSPARQQAHTPRHIAAQPRTARQGAPWSPPHLRGPQCCSGWALSLSAPQSQSPHCAMGLIAAFAAGTRHKPRGAAGTWPAMPTFPVMVAFCAEPCRGAGRERACLQDARGINHGCPEAKASRHPEEGPPRVGTLNPALP